jgi:hypothetical protein
MDCGLTAAALFAIVLPLSVRPASTTEWPTLRQELEKHGVEAAGIEDADRTITSYAVSTDDHWFAIAYYWYGGNDVLPAELRVRTLDRASRKRRHAVFNRERLNGGSAMRITRGSGAIYLDLHVNPSAGALIVLSENLTMRKRLDGWSALILPDGRVVYRHNTVHFAPAHPGSVSLYDPRSGRDVRLYPTKPAETLVGGRWTDRSISRVEQLDASRIRFDAREQDVTLGQTDGSALSGPARELSVTCDVSRQVPTCTARTRETGRR